MKADARISLIALILWGVLGCGPLSTQNLKDSQQERSIDGVKQIVVGIEDTQEPSTFNQSRYLVSSNHRVLLRYEKLESESQDVRLEGGRRVRVLIAPDKGTDLAHLQKHLKVCPLMRNWMMAATWKRAHPFNREGRWEADGGDFDRNECVVSKTNIEGFAIFDVTDWFSNYVRGRNQNFGLILISDDSVTIEGDAQGTLSPRIQWLITPIVSQMGTDAN